MSNEYEPIIYTLVDEEENEQKFEILDSMEIDEDIYYAMTPYYENPEDLTEDDGELIVLKSVREGDEEVLVTIDDEDEYKRIGNIFIEKLEAMFEEEE